MIPCLCIRARLQSCRKRLKIRWALAPEGCVSIHFDGSNDERNFSDWTLVSDLQIEEDVFAGVEGADGLRGALFPLERSPDRVVRIGGKIGEMIAAVGLGDVRLDVVVARVF